MRSVALPCHLEVLRPLSPETKSLESAADPTSGAPGVPVSHSGSQRGNGRKGRGERLSSEHQNPSVPCRIEGGGLETRRHCRAWVRLNLEALLQQSGSQR